MARIHARRKGKSGSTPPYDRKNSPEWCPLKPREIEARVLELAKKHHSSSEIGLVLRDQYGVPNVKLATGKKISKILEENNLKSDVPEDLANLLRKALKIRKHLEGHRKDKQNLRNLQLTEAKIRRLTKYYHRREKLPGEWKYTPERAKLMFK